MGVVLVMPEQWRTCPGFADYEVSDLGNVRRRTRSKNGYPAGYMLKPRPNPKGYGAVLLNRQNIFVHRLVAIAFIGPQPTPKHEINHRDGIKANNRPNNLEWVTHRENMVHATRMGLNETPTPPWMTRLLRLGYEVLAS